MFIDKVRQLNLVRKVYHSLPLALRNSFRTRLYNCYLNWRVRPSVFSARYHGKGAVQYTVIVPCYNVAQYIDDFVVSLTSQALDFKNKIKCIFVDDGSTDNTKEIIQKWVKKYPSNFSYIYKENGGLSSARNRGLDFVTTGWVTFIDPDDLIDRNYFKEVDDFIQSQSSQGVCLVNCHHVYYYESSGLIKDTHPLSFRFRFKRKFCVKEIPDIGEKIILSACTSFFRADLIKKQKLQFPTDVKPHFEDGFLISKFLLENLDKKVAYLRDAIYYYRKREAKSSLIDTAGSKPERYSVLLKNGYLRLLKETNEKFGVVPVFIQNVVLYDLSWILDYLLGHPNRFPTSVPEQDFISDIRSILSFIDAGLILDCRLGKLESFKYKSLVFCLKNSNQPEQKVYVERYDPWRKELLVRYFGNCDSQPIFYENYLPIRPISKKVQKLYFPGLEFNSFIFWLPIRNETSTLSVRVPNEWATIDYFGHSRDLFLGKVIKKFLLNLNLDSPYANAWLFMDRDVQADDNAEHLYRWIKKNHPEINAYFVLRRDSHDWPRLSKEKFKLLAYNSSEHRKALKECANIISSHADDYVVNFFQDNSLRTKHFVFLQHGVTKEDISPWLNNKFRIDLFVTASSREYDSIAGDFSPYKFTKHEVKLTGFPRHDALLYKSQHEKVRHRIVVMPTWRNNLVGETIDHGNKRMRIPEFKNTLYAKSWTALLTNNEFINLCRNNDYELIFFPHLNMQIYLSDFELDKHVKVLSHKDIEIQELFASSAILITDYSSVAFEMAYLKKPVLYYQFDKKEFLDSQGRNKGYFDYELDGFGPVCTDQSTLINSLKQILENNGKPKDKYLERMERYFEFRDGRCCERVFNEIKGLMAPSPNVKSDSQIQ